MKILCETTGPFQIVDFDNGGAVIRAHRPSVAVNSHLVSSRAAAGQIRVLGSVSDEATDDEFAEYWKESDGDQKLAVAAFLEAYPVLDDDAPAVDVKPRKPKAPKAVEPAVVTTPAVTE